MSGTLGIGSFDLHPVAWARFATAARWTLIAQLFLGGQARLTRHITPTAHDRAMEKAEGQLKYLGWIPAKSPTEHSAYIGAAMCAAGGLLCFPSTRIQGAVLSTSLSLMGVYSQFRMGIPFWLPSINAVLGSFIAYANVVGLG